MKFFLNLTNGIEKFEEFYDLDLSFIRIQSTICEQKDWNRVIMDLDNNFLLHVALGFDCIIYDYTHHGKESRACWQGVEFVKYCLNRIWFGRMQTSSNFSTYFNEQFCKLTKSVRKKLKYYRKFLLTDEIKIECICEKTNLDGKYEEYRKILKQFYAG